MNLARGAAIVLLVSGIACRAPESKPSAILQIAITTVPSSLDPQRATTMVTCDLARQRFEGLTALDVNQKPVPALAERWDVSADGRTYTFHLREASFSDGTTVKASDVRRCWERACDAKTFSPEADLFLGDVTGHAKGLTGVVADDAARILRVHLDRTSPAFLAKLANPICAVFRESGSDFIGSGPYVLSCAVEGVRYEFRPNAHARVAPKNPGLDFLVVSDSATRLNLFRAGKLDICPLGLGDAPAARSERPLWPRMRHMEMASVAFVQFNWHADPRLADVRARRAIAMATDRRRVADAVLNGTSSYANSLLPDCIPGATTDEDVPALDANAAQEIWWSLANPPKNLTLYYGDEDRLRNVAEAIVTSWRTHLGIDAKASFLQSGTLLAKNDRHEIAAYLTGWTGDYPDPENFVKAILDSRSPTNGSGYRNPAVDALIDRAEATIGRARIDLYRRAVSTALRDAPIVPLFHQSEFELVSSRIGGEVVLGPFGRPCLADVNLR